MRNALDRESSTAVNESTFVERPSAPAPSITRRGFFSLAAALGFSAATVGLEGLFVRAWADEPGNATSYKIYVVKRWEMPVCFLDMTDPDNPKSIAGARIDISSHYNQKSVQATTDDYGVAIIDITDLADPSLSDVGADVDAYAFYGSAIAEYAGYRAFETGKMYLRGGRQLDAPTEPLDGRLYVRCATIDGWDIQYAKSATFATTPANTYDHEIVVKLAGGIGGAKVRLWQEGGASIEGTSQFADDIATCVMKARLFSANAADKAVSLKPGKDVFLSVELDGDSKHSFTLVTHAAIMKGEREDARIEKDAAFSVIGFLSSGADSDSIYLSSDEAERDAADAQLSVLSELLPSPGNLSFTFPGEVPLLGGSKVSLSSIFPAMPVTCTMDPFGLLVLGAGYATKFDRQMSDWRTDTLENSTQRFKDLQQKWKSDYADWVERKSFEDLFRNKNTRVGSFPMTKDLSLNFQAGGMLMLQWGERLAKSGTSYEGDIQLYAILTGSASFTRQFFAYAVPFFLRAELSASARLSIDRGLSVKDGQLIPSSNSGTSLALQPSVALTAAVGLADVASIGVRGLGYFNFYLGFPAQLPAGKDFPHVTIGAGVNASVAVQLALFKFNAEVYAYDKPQLYDSWEGDSALQALSSSADEDAPFRHTAYLIDGGYLLSADADSLNLLSGGEGLRASAFADNAVPVTKSNLLASAEFKATRKETAALLSQREGASEKEVAETSPYELYEYEPAKGRGGFDEAALLATPAAPLKSLGAQGALMHGGLVHADVFSDPRIKVVSVKGVPWMFRILTVSYETDSGAQPRTRLSVSKWNASAANWGKAQVIDFAAMYPAGASSSAPKREDLYDYDYALLSAFDVAGLPDGDMWQDGSLVRVFLISGTREGSDASSVGSALSHTVGSFLGIGENPDGSLVIRTAHSFLDVYDRVPDTAQATASGAALTCSTLVNPCIASAQDSRGSNVTAVFAFCRAAASPDALVNGPYEEKPATALFTSQGLSLVGSNPFCYVSAGQAGFTDDFKAMITDVKHSVSVGILSSKVYDANQFILGCHYTTVAADGTSTLKSFAIVRNTNVNSPSQDDTGEVWLMGKQAGVRFAHPWKAAGAASALCCTETGLSTASFTLGSNGAPTGVTLEDVSLDKDIDLSSFALNESTGMLYYATTREGKVPGISEGSGAAGSAEYVADYRIWASHYAKIGADQGFIKPFSLIQTPDPIDSLAVTNFEDSYGFMTNGLVSLSESLSNIMFYRLPFIRSIRLLDFASEHEFVCAGETEPFFITVRNEGNVALSSFTIAIKADGMAEQRIKLDLRDTERVEPLVGVEDVSDKADESIQGTGEAGYRHPEFSLAVKAGILNPGETRSYRFSWMVPEAFQGLTELDVVAVNEGAEAPGAAGVEGSCKLYANAGSLDVLGAQFTHAPVKSATEIHAPMSSVASDGNDIWATKSRYYYANEEVPGPSLEPEQPVEIAPSGDGLSRVAATAAALAGLGAAGIGIASAFASDPEKRQSANR